MTDYMRISFSSCETVAQALSNEASILFDVLYQIEQTARRMLDASFEANFRSEIEFRYMEVRKNLEILANETDEMGRDLAYTAQLCRDLDATCATYFSSHQGIPSFQSFLQAILNSSGSLFPSDVWRITQAILGNIQNPGVISNVLRDLGYGSLSDYLNWAEQSASFQILPDLLGAILDESDIPIVGNLIDLIDRIDEEGLSTDSIGEWVAASLIEFGIGSSVVGSAILIGNTLLQAGGSITIDAHSIYRDLVTGGDSSLNSYQIMDYGIRQFRDALDDADLGELIDAAAAVGSDVYIEPVINQFQATWENPSISNLFMLSQLVSGSAPAQAIWMANHPEQITETLEDMAALTGQSIDFRNGIDRLPMTGVLMTESVVVGTGSRILEVFNIDDPIADTIVESGLLQHNLALDYSETLRSFAEQILR